MTISSLRLQLTCPSGRRAAYGLIFFLAVSCQPLAVSCLASEPEKYTLENRLTIIVKEAPGNGLIAASVFVKTPKNAGVSGMTASLLLSGTETKSAEAIAEELEAFASRMDVENAPDYTEISLLSLSGHFEEGMAILGDILSNSAFPKKEINKQKNETIAAIKQIDDHPDTLVYNELLSLLYKNHPYGIKPQDEIPSIKRINHDQLVKFYKQHYTPQNMVISIAGDITKYEAYELCKKFLNGNRGGFEKEKPVKNPQILGKTSEKTLKKANLAADWLEIGFLAASINDSDYAATKLLSSILGSGMSSRLFIEVREKEGLVYAIDSFLPSRKLTSHLAIHAICSSANLSKVKKLIFNELQTLKDESVSEGELAKCKSSINGKFIINHEELSQKAWHLGWFEIMGLGFQMDSQYPNLINNVTSDDIKKAANKFFTNYCAVTLNPKK